MLFARNDVDFFNVPVGSGGCGAPGGHRRPVIDGAPVRPWRVECVSCEPFLRERMSDLFASSEADVAETPDETKGREDFQKRGATDRDNILAIAMAKLAGVELPQTIRQSISGASPQIDAIAGKIVCRDGHDCEPGSVFCDECGSEMRPPAGNVCAEGHQNRAGAKFCATCRASLQPAPAAIEPPAPRVPAAAPAVREAAAKKKPIKDWKLDDLRAEARTRGLDDSGTRLEVLDRIRHARVPQAA